MRNHGVLMPMSPRKRRRAARAIRKRAFALSNNGTLPVHRNNGEEQEYIRDCGFPVTSYSKGMPHNARGEVSLADYEKLRHALRSGEDADFSRIPIGTASPPGRRLLNPQAGLAFDLEVPDAQRITMRPAPRSDSRKGDAEMIELYWMALMRDVPFTSYASGEGTPSAVADVAAQELETYRDELDVPFIGGITPRTLFRGRTRGDIKGPYISQFLMHDFEFGPVHVLASRRSPVAGRDHLTNFAQWLAIQNGAQPVSGDVFETTPHYIRNLRDLAHYSHMDPFFHAYVEATLLIAPDGPRILDPGNPYLMTPNQEGFVTFGGPAILTMIAEVTTRALKAMWFQKWNVHRKLRPEEYGGRVDVHRRQQAHYPVSAELLASEAHQRTLSQFGSSLLPQAYPEGCPMHPSYGAGHAAIAGACATILKAWVNENVPWTRRVLVPSADGTSVIDYTGPDARMLTVGGEIDKLASNIALGRCIGGVHWRSDYTEGLRLGECVALQVLAEHVLCFNERSFRFTLTDFDGNTQVIDSADRRGLEARLAGSPVAAASAAS